MSCSWQWRSAVEGSFSDSRKTVKLRKWWHNIFIISRRSEQAVASSSYSNQWKVELWKQACFFYPLLCFLKLFIYTNNNFLKTGKIWFQTSANYLSFTKPSYFLMLSFLKDGLISMTAFVRCLITFVWAYSL